MADDTYAADDAILLYLVRDGDIEAFDALWERHEQAAWRLSRCLVPVNQAGEVVTEASGWILDLTLHGGGPVDSFRTYLLTALRQVAEEWLRPGHGSVAAEEAESAGPDELLLDPLMAHLSTSLVVKAFRSLPERWVAVLWHTKVEQEDPAEVAKVLGIEPDEIGTLQQRAWDGLRHACLLMYRAKPECQPAVQRLAEFTAGQASAGDSAIVTEHLSQCDGCRAACAELSDLDTALTAKVAPAYLGSAAACYLSAQTAPEEVADADAGTVASGAAAFTGPATSEFSPAAAGRPTALLPRRRHGRQQASGPSRRKALTWTAVAAVPVIAIGIVLALFVTGPGPGPSRQQALTATSPSSAATGQPAGQPQTPTAGTPQNTAAATRPPASTPSPPPASPSVPATTPAAASAPPPAPAVTLSAMVDVSARGRSSDLVTWAVTDTGHAAAGAVTVALTLPAGTELMSSGEAGWTCEQTMSGASCQHGSLSPGSAAQGAVLISVDHHSCGQPVSLAAAAGTATISARSPDGIACDPRHE